MNDKKNLSNIDLLKINLMINKEVDKKAKTENSVKRENLINQVLIDNFDLEINNESEIFQKERITKYIEVIFTKESNPEKMLENAIKRSVYLKNSDNMEIKCSFFEKEYTIGVTPNYLFIKEENYFCKSYDIEPSTNVSSGTNSIGSNKSKKSKNSKSPYVPKYFYDKIGEETYYIMITQREHEIDGSLKTKSKITDLKGLVNIMIYPESNNNIVIDKNERIIIEAKQNATLSSTYKQMKKYMRDISQIFPDKHFHYFSFINDINYKLDNNNNIINEKEFFKTINEDLEAFANFKIYIFIIKDNKLLDNSLVEQSDYATHYYYLSNKRFEKIEQTINNIVIKQEKMEQAINNIMIKEEQMEKKIDGMEQAIKDMKNTFEKKMDYIINQISFDSNRKGNSGYFYSNNWRSNNYYYKRGGRYDNTIRRPKDYYKNSYEDNYGWNGKNNYRKGRRNNI